MNMGSLDQDFRQLPATSDPHVGRIVDRSGMEGSEPSPSPGVSGALAPDSEGRPPSIESCSFSTANVEGSEGEDEPTTDALAGTPGMKRATRRRQKQREKRKLNRASKRASKSLESGAVDEPASQQPEENHEGAKKMLHRPGPAQRTAHAVIEMDQCYRLFHGLSWYSHVKERDPMSWETAQAMLQAAWKTWFGENRQRTFHSAQELERFISAKDSELRYLNTHLSRASVLQRPAWNNQELKPSDVFMSSLQGLFEAWGVAESQTVDKLEALQEAARFFQNVVVPSLEAQLVELRRRLASARKLEAQLSKIRAKLAEQEEERCNLKSLLEDQSYILPICPIWRELGVEIERIKSLGNQDNSWALEEEEELLLVEYTQSLQWVYDCRVAY
ncbi:hypothetical protein ACJZ2D_014104 [Fusarium nematophilum]